MREKRKGERERQAHSHLARVDSGFDDVSVPLIGDVGRNAGWFVYVHVEVGRLSSSPFRVVSTDEHRDFENVSRVWPVLEIRESLIGGVVEVGDAEKEVEQRKGGVSNS
jgi:hypothetical protein